MFVPHLQNVQKTTIEAFNHVVRRASEVDFREVCHLGLTCDPIGGYVQIPCIERNAIAAVRAVDCAAYALLSDGHHIVSFDEVVRTMWETGRDLKAGYRETARGGLARVHALRRKDARGFHGMGS